MIGNSLRCNNTRGTLTESDGPTTQKARLLNSGPDITLILLANQARLQDFGKLYLGYNAHEVRVSMKRHHGPLHEDFGHINFRNISRLRAWI